MVEEKEMVKKKETEEEIGKEGNPYDESVHDKLIDEDGQPNPLSPSENIMSINDILDAVKELTKTISDLVKAQNEMKERHDKWIKAGKF